VVTKGRKESLVGGLLVQLQQLHLLHEVQVAVAAKMSIVALLVLPLPWRLPLLLVLLLLTTKHKVQQEKVNPGLTLLDIQTVVVKKKTLLFSRYHAIFITRTDHACFLADLPIKCLFLDSLGL
jgi:hypothetical protein